MLRYNKPSRIELKKSDLDDLERKKIEDQKKEKVVSKLPLADVTQNDSMTTSAPLASRARQTEIRRRLGFTPEAVPNDGTAGIRF